MKFLSSQVFIFMLAVGSSLSAGISSSDSYHDESSKATSLIANAMAFNVQFSEELRAAIEDMDKDEYELLSLDTAELIQEMQRYSCLLTDFKGPLSLNNKSVFYFNPALWPALEGLWLENCALPSDLRALKDLRMLYVDRATFDSAKVALSRGTSYFLPSSLEFIEVFLDCIGRSQLMVRKSTTELIMQGFKFSKNSDKDAI